jgi:hypothetical protein
MRPLVLLGFVLLALPSPAAARTPSIYINDVKVDGLRGQTLTSVDVLFDDNGDIHITAKGYKITALDAPKSAAPATPQATGHHYYIATQQPPGRDGVAQWDIDLYVNKVYVHRFRSSDAEPLFEITRFLKPGTNTFHFTPRKEGGDRRSNSPNDYFELVVGNGEMRAGQVMMNKLTAYRRTAAESSAEDSETTLELATPGSP